MKRFVVLAMILSGCVEGPPPAPGQMVAPPPVVFTPMNPADYTVARPQAPLTSGMKVCPNGMIVQAYYIC